jgi:uncharacterized SAM-binding protein YcdF (DUF218 family)
MFFLASKIFWALAQPSNLVLLLLATGALALLLGRRRLASWLLYPAVLVFLLVGLLPVGEWLSLPLENRFPPPAEPPGEVAGIIVLGGAVDLDVAQARGMVAFHREAERDITLLELARRYPDAELIYTGNSSWPPFLRQHGLANRVVFEERARNTYENAVLSKQLASPAPGEHWLLVTSAAHMPRSVGVFRKVGWPVIPYPVDYNTTGAVEMLVTPDAARRWNEFDRAVKAWVGLLAYWLTGRSSALSRHPDRPALPGAQCAMITGSSAAPRM